MTALAGRRIVLGVCGGIAAYKAVELCRRLVELGAHVVPVMTESATRFVGEVTFSALGSEPVRRELFGDVRDPIPHTTLGQSADLVLVAPATARLLSSYASGNCEDLLGNVLVATRAPVIVCPAMHTEMWEHPAVRRNVEQLRRDGVVVVDPEEGALAGGDVGAGRLAGIETIVAAAEAALGPGRAGALEGLKVLVTAGGTREPLDPVRFIGNRSSGKQGHAVAEEAFARGGEVVLVTTAGIPSSAGIERVEVETAQQMFDAVVGRAPSCDVVVMAAAVADFAPVAVSAQKLKKGDGIPVVELRPTADILADLGEAKPAGQTLVGFAAETTDVAANAAAKLKSKNLDLMVANDVAMEGVGFEHDTNEVLILSVDGGTRHVPLTDKRTVAGAILDSIIEARSRRGD